MDCLKVLLLCGLHLINLHLLLKTISFLLENPRLTLDYLMVSLFDLQVYGSTINLDLLGHNISNYIYIHTHTHNASLSFFFSSLNISRLWIITGLIQKN